MTDLFVREYGRGNDLVIALHGGPGAAGDVRPLARELGERWHVFEPFQRGSGSHPLTVATHVQDLDDIIRARCDGRHPVIVGHSWGAMLALAYGAEHPAASAALVLIGCGTFSAGTRAVLEERIEARLTPAHRASLARIRETEADADRRLAELGRLITQVCGCDVEDAADDDMARVDAAANEETWGDMLRLQRDGLYPAAFAAIHGPVLMIHGEADPHPGRLIRDELQPYLPQLEYRELPACGHYPWLERQARDAFFETLNRWLDHVWSVR